MRYTKKQLFYYVETINKELKKEDEYYSVACYNGGYRLVKVYKNTSERNISFLCSCKEMYYILDSIYNLIREEKRDI